MSELIYQSAFLQSNSHKGEKRCHEPVDERETISGLHSAIKSRLTFAHHFAKKRCAYTTLIMCTFSSNHQGHISLKENY